MSQGEAPEAAGPRAAAAGLTDADHPASRVSPRAAAALERQLLQPLAAGYVPRLPIHSSRFGDRLFFDFFYEVEWMCRDDAIRLPLQFVMGPAAHAEAEVEARSSAEAHFIARQWQWFWSNAVPIIQEEAYPYGWCPGEVTYDVRDGLMEQCGFTTFNPRDADPLLLDGKPVGIRVQMTASGVTDLWGWRTDVPNKAYWYAHLAKRGLRRGQSQIWSAYRPWLRLTGRDGGEELVDLGYYRLALPIIAVDHPNETYKAIGGAVPPYAVGGVVHTRDEARAIGENIKSGASVAVDSRTGEKGARKWDVRAIQTGANGSQLIEYVEYLERKCAKGVGVPPELFQASETGSGYSGRAIPLEAFLTAQQRPVNDLTRSWLDQIGLPLLRWNFGPDAWARVTPKPLLGSYKQNAWDKPGGDAGPPSGGPPGAAPPGAPMATMSTEFSGGSSACLVRGSGGIVPLGKPSWVTVPDTAFLSTALDTDSFAARLATMTDAELVAIAGDPDGLGD